MALPLLLETNFNVNLFEGNRLTFLGGRNGEDTREKKALASQADYYLLLNDDTLLMKGCFDWLTKS